MATGAAAFLPHVALAEQAALPVIGFLGSASPGPWTDRLRAFRLGLSETGFDEGRNVTIEYRWAEDRIDRLPALASDLVRHGVSVIVANGPASDAAKAATTTIPIVFFSGLDPVQRGFVASLARPGGNLTGVSALFTDEGPKRLELLHEVIPTATSFALLVNPATTGTLASDMDAAARGRGLQLHVLNAKTESEFDSAFATLVQLRAGALVIGNDAFFTTRREQLAALTVRHGVPAIFQFREFAAAGGLMSFGSSDTDAFRTMGVYAARILKGEKPADLPVQQATKFELIINLGTAKSLGITIPQSILVRADEVIE